MVYTESARIIGAGELKEIIEETYSNPTIERLIFIEAKGKDDVPSKVFPCYAEAWALEDEKDPLSPLVFQLCILQSAGGEFGMVRVMVKERDLNYTKRFWDKPPTKGLRDDNPFIEEEVQ